ncbi:hypothetical protein AgCh_028476 [Apium graveolens]
MAKTQEKGISPVKQGSKKNKYKKPKSPVNEVSNNSENKKPQEQLEEVPQGICARTMVPINISSWPKVDDDLNAKIWSDIQETFKVAPKSEGLILKSAAAKWRQFKSNLTSDYVKPFAGQKKKLAKPPRKYAFVGKDAWKQFIAMRTSSDRVVLDIFEMSCLIYFMFSF